MKFRLILNYLLPLLLFACGTVETNEKQSNGPGSTQPPAVQAEPDVAKTRAITLYNEIVIEVPAKWSEQFFEDSKVYNFKADRDIFREGYTANISIQKAPLESSVEVFLKQYIEESKGYLEDFKLIKQEKASLSEDFDTRYMMISGRSNGNSLAASIVFHIVGETAYIFTGAGLHNSKGQAAKYMKLYQPVFESMRLKE